VEGRTFGWLTRCWPAVSAYECGTAHADCLIEIAMVRLIAAVGSAGLVSNREGGAVSVPDGSGNVVSRDLEQRVGRSGGFRPAWRVECLA
jgi:hypothetical protein